MSRPLPWHAESWRRFEQHRHGQRVPHALLISGLPGIGKRAFAEAMAASLLCERVDDQGLACGHCAMCQLVAAGSHPERLIIEPEEEKRTIPVDAIRELIRRAGLTRQYGHYRAVLIEPADALTASAANALLKTLEEPVPGTVMLLISSRPARLPATIRSRCQKWPLPLPEHEVALAWLQQQRPASDRERMRRLLAITGGAPLEALRLLEAGADGVLESLSMELEQLSNGTADPLKVAARWDKAGALLALAWLYSALADMVRLQLAGGPNDAARPGNPAQAEALLDFQQRVAWLLGQLQGGAPLKSLLALEELLIDWQRMGAAARRTR